MEQQKICIIGGSLTGLVTAISLSKLNCKIDLITGDITKNLKSNRTVAISENNLKFLSELNLSKSFKKKMWCCSVMKIYTEIKNKKISEIFELNKEKNKEKILYISENSKIMNLMMNKVRKIKSILVKDKKVVSSISTSGSLKKVKFDNESSLYNLVIVCTGNNSGLVKNISDETIIKNSYNEFAITSILKHEFVKNSIARQIFFKNEILALLPISNSKTSIVWTVKNNLKGKNNSYLKNRLKFYIKNFYKKAKFVANLEYKDLNFIVRKKYYHDRILLFGDALHVLHPFVGQGFNMTLRDLSTLRKVLNEKINLGLDVGSSDILAEFSSEAKPRNFAFSFGVDILKNSFKNEKLRDDVLKILNKNNFAKNIFFNIADKGLRF